MKVNKNLRIFSFLDSAGDKSGKVRETWLSRSMMTWVGLESMMLGETSQEVKDKYHMTSLISGT